MCAQKYCSEITIFECYLFRLINVSSFFYIFHFFCLRKIFFSLSLEIFFTGHLSFYLLSARNIYIKRKKYLFYCYLNYFANAFLLIYEMRLIINLQQHFAFIIFQ